MESISFVFADRNTVPGWIGLDVQKEVISHIEELGADRILLVTDHTVDQLHGEYFAPLRKAEKDARTGGGSPVDPPAVEKMVLPAGDAAKSWDHLTELIQWNFRIGATKKSVVVAFGGGALLNACGLFASIAYRGMKLVYVPTTLLAMHDVVTSLKTSICFDGRKNNIGTFYAPLKILIDVAFCRTLPKMELFSGLGELAKNAALLGGEHARGFVLAFSKETVGASNGGTGEELSLSDDTVLSLTRLGIKAKMEVLLHDAYEKNSGMIFEYGHTMSHAIEKTYGDGVVPHGIGVTYGMLACSYAAEELGIMTSEARKEHDEVCHLLLVRWPLPEPKPRVEEVMARAMRDSKRGITSEASTEISDILLTSMGDIVPTKTSMLSKFPAKLFAEWLETMGFPTHSAKAPPKHATGVMKKVPEEDALLDTAVAA